MAAEVTFLRVKPGDLLAFFRRQKRLDDGAAETAQFVGESRLASATNLAVWDGGHGKA
jgi:hypothetical protein